MRTVVVIAIVGNFLSYARAVYNTAVKLGLDKPPFVA